MQRSEQSAPNHLQTDLPRIIPLRLPIKADSASDHRDIVASKEEELTRYTHLSFVARQDGNGELADTFSPGLFHSVCGKALLINLGRRSRVRQSSSTSPVWRIGPAYTVQLAEPTSPIRSCVPYICRLAPRKSGLNERPGSDGVSRPGLTTLISPCRRKSFRLFGVACQPARGCNGSVSTLSRMDMSAGRRPGRREGRVF